MMDGGFSSSTNSYLMAFGENNNNNNNTSSNNGEDRVVVCPTTMMMQPQPQPQPQPHHPLNNNTTSINSLFVDTNINITPNNNYDGNTSLLLKSKIMAHPHYHRLLSAYINCQKIGAPPEVVARLEEASATVATMNRGRASSITGEDPSLDQFMEAYIEMLTKYEQQLSKPLNQAMLFLSTIDSQFKALSLSSSHSISTCADQAMDRNNGSEEEEVEVHNNLIDPQAEDRELKGQLLRKYSGYLGSLKQELYMKKKKKRKLPKEARQQLLQWWTGHYKWPYPSESQKLALAESTGLDPKQINNWFINQRKRHWKPSEDMQFKVMDDDHATSHPHHYYYAQHMLLGDNPFPMDITPALF